MEHTADLRTIIFMGVIQPIPIIANYRNLHKQDTDFLGGYLTFVWTTRSAVCKNGVPDGIGADYKDALAEPGLWYAGIVYAG